eukprot:g2692.t1
MTDDDQDRQSRISEQIAKQQEDIQRLDREVAELLAKMEDGGEDLEKLSKKVTQLTLIKGRHKQRILELENIDHEGREYSKGEKVLQMAYDNFQKYQVNSRVSLRALEYVMAAQFAELDLSVSKVEHLFKIADLDLDGHLCFSEFYSLFACLTVLIDFFGKKAKRAKRLHIKDVRRALATVGLDATENQVARMFIMGDQDRRTGKQIQEIDVETFVKIYLEQQREIHGHIFLRKWYAAGKSFQTLRTTAEVTPTEELIAGTWAGIALTVVGHPFDTVKVRVQMSSNTGVSQAIFGLMKNEGPLAFFKGMGGPMATIPFINAVVFAAYGQAKDFLLGDAQRPLTLTECSIAGGYAGLMSTVIACPVELIKTRLQMQTCKSLRESTFNGPFDCAAQILRRNGVKGLYRGNMATIYREIPGFGGQFLVYEWMKRYFARDGHIDDLGPIELINGHIDDLGPIELINGHIDDLGPLELISAGGVAGAAGWVVSYPMDYVKTHLQSEAFDKPTPYKKKKWLLDGGFFSCMFQAVRTHGYRELWRGFLPCIARSFPANGAGFFAYETALSWMRSYDDIEYESQ